MGIKPLHIHDSRKKNFAPSQKGAGENETAYRVYKDKKGEIYTPILIPFFYQKEDWLGERWRPVFENHWASAKRHLLKNRVQEIYFLGYSLPRADHYMLSWLLDIIERAKVPKSKIKIVCKCDAGLLEKSLKLPEGNIHRCGLELFLKTVDC